MYKKRSEIITKKMIGLEVLVHNGRKYQSLLIEEDMVGKKYGQFVFTRRLVNKIHKEK